VSLFAILKHKSKTLGWYARTLARHGRPNTVLFFGEAPGDDLLCTVVLRELRQRGHGGVWMVSRHPSLFLGNTDVDAVIAPHEKIRKLSERTKAHYVRLRYTERDPATDRDAPPSKHIIALLCAAAGITGTVTIRPNLLLTQEERQAGVLAPRQIAIQTTGRSATYAMSNKEWFPERFQHVVDELKSEFNFIQVGSGTDPPLANVIDRRGKNTLRQTAAIMANSVCFIGLVGFPMHLARAVDCRSVIVYGGREHPDQSGYPCNENLYSPLSCSPCWLWDRCDFNRVCMTQIAAGDVVSAFRRLTSRFESPLETAQVNI
jgi:ADP-heptose:LPS heptosyltransferase